MLVLRGVSTPAPSATVLTIGNFDGVHMGHRALLRRLTDTASQCGLPAAVLKKRNKKEEQKNFEESE